jgi:PilZ domain
MYAVFNISMTSGRKLDFRNTVRFPLHLQATLKTPAGEYHAVTTDISAGGILFRTDCDIAVDSPVEFTFEMPGDILATDHPVLVKCCGRVVRCSQEQAERSIAVVIDDYHFE